MPVSWDTIYTGLTEKYGFTPQEINELTRNQLLVYCGVVDEARGREKLLLQKQTEGLMKRGR